MENLKFIHPPNVDFILHSVDGFIVVAEFNKKSSKLELESENPSLNQRFYGFFSDKGEMNDFVKNAAMKIVSIKKIQVVYRDGEGLNYA